jgi:hypothetical protein
MSEQKNNRDKWLHIRLTQLEFKKIKTGFSNSTKRQISEYVRAILLDKPITIYTRNQSFDDFVAELILLRRELNAIGNNFNQSVKKLNAMSDMAEIKIWVMLNEKSKPLLFRKIDEINEKLAQISEKWLQE